MVLRVHSWGGLGSQMFALAEIFEIRQEHPRRRIKVIHHTSGLSKRLFEIEFMLDDKTQLITCDDYVKQNYQGNTKNYKSKKSIRKAIKRILNFFAISIDFDSYEIVKSIKPWTYEIRGHYSNILISEKFLENCVEFYKIGSTEKARVQNSLVVHYRLGDLINLPGRPNIKSNEVIQAVQDSSKANCFDRIIIYSDSVHIASKMLIKLEELMIPIEYSDLPTTLLVKHSIAAKFFIGTNSKVSIWIVYIRNYLGLQSTIFKN